MVKIIILLISYLGKGVYVYQMRFEIWKNSLSMLDISEWFTGAGLTSVLVSGPHNDYIRWLQRAGFIVMFISFYPYFSVLFKSYIDTISYKKDKTNLYILCAVYIYSLSLNLWVSKRRCVPSNMVFFRNSNVVRVSQLQTKKDVVEADKSYTLVY